MTGAATRVRATAVAAALLGLVALVVVASDGPRPKSAGSETNLAGVADVRDIFFTALMTVFAIVLVALLAYIVRESRVREFRPPNPWDFRSLLGFLLAAAALAFFILSAPDRVWLRLQELGGAVSDGRLESRGPDGRVGEAAGEPEFRWWLAAAIVGLVGAGIAASLLWSRAERRKPVPPPEPLADELAAAVDASLLDLAAEPDPRRAVIVAYAQMERILAAGGAARRPSEVPFEYLARVLGELAVRPPAVLALTELFERARFSRHEIDPAMRDEATQALAAVREDLKAAA